MASFDYYGVTTRLPANITSVQDVKNLLMQPGLSEETKKKLIHVLDAFNEKVLKPMITVRPGREEFLKMLEKHQFRHQVKEKIALGGWLTMALGIILLPATGGASILIAGGGAVAAIATPVVLIEENKLKQMIQHINDGKSYDEARKLVYRS